MLLSVGGIAFRIENKVTKKFLNKFTVCLAALLLYAGAAFFCCGFSYRLPRGVSVNGTDVSGMTRTCAKEVLRKREREYLKDKRLRICAGERVYVYSYPEINFTDYFEETLRGINKKGRYSAPVKYYLNGESEIVNYICDGLDSPPQEPYCTFNLSGEPFTYYGGVNGTECGRQKLTDDINKSLAGGFSDVNVRIRKVATQNTVDDVVKKTVRLYGFTTYFDGANVERSANIRLAASKLNGLILGAGEEFSFNRTVGARTAENGFRQAKIIENGKFVTGYGGGVCQVSTTVYNAAVLSGMDISEYHPHSLQVSYVEPSRDAMVSGSYFDLKFKNNRQTPVYMRVTASLNSVTCILYGEEDGYRYEFRSLVTGSVPRPPAVVEEGEEDGVISYGRDGTLSEGTAVKIKDGKEYPVFVRKDRYAPSADVIAVKKRDVSVKFR